MTEPIDEYYYLKPIEPDNQKDPENLLVEMSVTLNNLCRFYDEKNEQGIKFIVDKAYELSHRGISHLTELDRLTEQLAKERELRKELVEHFEGLISQQQFRSNWPHTTKQMESLIQKAKDYEA